MWCIIFFAAVIGLVYLSKGIIGHFIMRDVRTEVRMEQKEEQPWPSITICSQDALIQHFTCNGNVSLLTSRTSVGLCLKQFKSPIVTEKTEKQHFDTKQGCMVYNLNGSLMHRDSMKRGLDITINAANVDLEDPTINVIFHDPQLAKNSSYAVFLQDLDFEGGSLSPGTYEFLLEMTEIEKLGPPYNSNCTNKKTIPDKQHSKYSYAACMDQCIARQTFKECGDVPHALQNYIGSHNVTNSSNATCIADRIEEYERNPTFRKTCRCEQPCRQRLYAVTRNLVGNDYNPTWVLRIRFKSKMVNTIKEHPLYSVEELISQVGGSCGLFLGMSILSVVEIIFHAIISLAKCCVSNVRK